MAFFALLAVFLMWPVPAHLSTQVPGTSTWAFDESTFLWNNWYFRHALLDLHASPLHSNLIWYPLGIDLILYTFNFTNAGLALPLQLAANLPLASNVTLLLATTLSGLGAYLLARDVLRRPDRQLPAILAALLAGVIYAAGSNRAIYLALGHYNMASTAWLAFYTLYLLKLLREPARKNAVLAGLFFALAGLTDLIFAAFLALLSLLIVLLIWPEWRGDGREPPRTGRAAGAALTRLGLAALVAVLLLSPVLVPTAAELANGGYALKGWGDSLNLSADLAGLVTPTDLNPLIAPPAAPLTTPAAPGERPGWQAELRAVAEGKGRFTDINTVFLGYVTLGLALLGALLPATRRRARLFAGSALVFGLLCLGPLLQIGGRYRFSFDNLLPDGVTVPLPFILVHYIPVLNANRAANRFSTVLMLCLAVLAALGAWWLLDRLAGARRGGSVIAVPALAALLAVALVGEHLAVPLPTVAATVPEIYRQIAAEPGDFSILQLPLGWRNSFETY
ncbi:MAG TPA: hypothetical protein VGA61_13335, partial [Anaerolineae bacterium]